MDLLKLSIPKIADKLRKKEISVLELSSTYLDRIKKLKGLNAYITTLEDDVCLSAKKMDEMGVKESDHILKGIPVALKDNIMAQGIKILVALRC